MWRTRSFTVARFPTSKERNIDAPVTIRSQAATDRGKLIRRESNIIVVYQIRIMFDVGIKCDETLKIYYKNLLYLIVKSTAIEYLIYLSIRYISCPFLNISLNLRDF